MAILEDRMEVWEETQERELTRWKEQIGGFYLFGTIPWVEENKPAEWRKYKQLEELLERACLKKNGSVLKQAVDKCVEQMRKMVGLYEQYREGVNYAGELVQEGGEAGAGQEGDMVV